MKSIGTTLSKSAYRHKLVFQKCLFLNFYLYIVWFSVVGISLTHKLHMINFLGKLTSYLYVTVFTLLVFIEGFRLSIGELATTRNRVPEMGGFLLITTLMQLPLVSFLLFNPYLHNMPVEIILNSFLWFFGIIETVYGYMELKQISAIASSIYYAQYKDRNMQHCIDR